MVCVRLLFYNIKVVYTFYEKRTPLHEAASNGVKDVATLLINSGANLDAVDNVSYIHLLHSSYIMLSCIQNHDVAPPLYKVSYCV